MDAAPANTGTVQAQALALTAAQTENAGLQQRLADRVAEAHALNQQLTQARVQFEHFQDAIAHQRSEEQQVFEQRIARLENELTTGLRAKKRNKPCSRNRRRP